MALPMQTGNARLHSQGFVYIALLIGLAMVGMGLGATAEVWTQTRQREKEVELLFAGDQIRQAITHYYLLSPPAARRFPNSLDELVDDNRTPGTPLHHLRKIYADPMDAGAWGEIRLAGGQLVGVYSQSRDKPIKVAGFAKRNAKLANQEMYSDWVFRSPLPAANPILGAGEGYSTQPTQPTLPVKPAPLLPGTLRRP